MRLFLAPHNDDECLFGTFTLLRFKPLVVVCTKSQRHLDRYGIDPNERIKESRQACDYLDVHCNFLDIPDSQLGSDNLVDALKTYSPSIVFAPAIQDGNADHNIVGLVAMELWGNRVIPYATYTKTNLKPIGNFEVKPTMMESEQKKVALSFYISQHNINEPHFKAVESGSEYWII